jgi:uncharacterized membrane protein YoaK (UPF0700 family)
VYASDSPTDRAPHTESRLAVAAVLAASGGFLDGFTYLGHGHVFANAMTGNVVILGINAATGHWNQAIAHVYPIAAFLMGVAVAQVFHVPRVQQHVPHATLASLALEIFFLGIGGCFAPEFASTFLVLGISFVAALQSSTFRLAGKWSYNSTMTTGNLRIFSEALFQILFGTRDTDSADKVKVFGTLCATFLAGAVAGGLSTAAFHNRALWIVDILLLALWFWLFGSVRRAALHSVKELQR